LLDATATKTCPLFLILVTLMKLLLL